MRKTENFHEEGFARGGLRYIDELILRERDTDGNGSLNERLYYLQDANFNVTALVNTTGTVQERYAYEPYGELIVLTPAWGSRSSSSFANPYTYTGRRRDSESGLYYYRYRYYHAPLGKFLSRDPAIYRGSRWNLYEYSKSVPLSGRDPSGMAVIIGGAIVVGVVGKACICHLHKRSWDEKYGARKATGIEKRCLDRAVKYLPGPIRHGSVARCMMNLSMANNVKDPTTMCHVGCQLPPFNQGVHTYLGATDVDCRSCFSTLNLMMTLVHECWHQRLGCPGEVETYEYAIGVFKRLLKMQCAAMARDGVCKNEAECKQAIDDIIEVEEEQLEIERRAAQ